MYKGLSNSLGLCERKGRNVLLQGCLQGVSEVMVVGFENGLCRPGAQPVGAFDPAYCPGDPIFPNR